MAGGAASAKSSVSSSRSTNVGGSSSSPAHTDPTPNQGTTAPVVTSSSKHGGGSGGTQTSAQTQGQHLTYSWGGGVKAYKHASGRAPVESRLPDGAMAVGWAVRRLRWNG